MPNQLNPDKLNYFEGSFCAVRPSWLRKKLGNATGKGIKVGVVDSGWDNFLDDDRIKSGVCLVDPSNQLKLCCSDDYSDQNGHGTSVTDIILQVAPDVSVYPIKIFGERIETSLSILVESIKWAISNELNIINLSLATILPEALKPLYMVCELARKRGIVIVAAKSNNLDWSYPSMFENVISVEKGIFESIFDFTYTYDDAIECRAKSWHNNSLRTQSYRYQQTGNSLAAPIITGIIAMILECNPTANLKYIRKKLCEYSVKPQFDNSIKLEDLI